MSGLTRRPAQQWGVVLSHGYSIVAGRASSRSSAPATTWGIDGREVICASDERELRSEDVLGEALTVGGLEEGVLRAPDDRRRDGERGERRGKRLGRSRVERAHLLLLLIGVGKVELGCYPW
jgi:hypothetical protein